MLWLRTYRRRSGFRMVFLPVLALIFCLGVATTASGSLPGEGDDPKTALCSVDSAFDDSLSPANTAQTLLEDARTQPVAHSTPTPSTHLPYVTPTPGANASALPEPTSALPEDTPLPSFLPGDEAVIVAQEQGETLGVVIEMLQRDAKTFFIADIRIKDGGQIKNGFAMGKFGANNRETVQAIAQRYSECVFAVNGDFYNFHGDGIVLRDGELYRDANHRENVDLLLIGADGTMSSVPETETDVAALLESGIVNVYSFGPALVVNGEVTPAVSRKGRANEPRCAVGMVEPGHYVIILCDGRRADWSEGCTLKELAELFVERGVPFAYNMDGGGSSAMFFQGEVVNKPSNGWRSISDILFFSR